MVKNNANVTQHAMSDNLLDRLFITMRLWGVIEQGCINWDDMKDFLKKFQKLKSNLLYRKSPLTSPQNIAELQVHRKFLHIFITSRKRSQGNLTHHFHEEKCLENLN